MIINPCLKLEFDEAVFERSLSKVRDIRSFFG